MCIRDRVNTVKAGIRNITKVEYRLNKACDFSDLIKIKGSLKQRALIKNYWLNSQASWTAWVASSGEIIPAAKSVETSFTTLPISAPKNWS